MNYAKPGSPSNSIAREVPIVFGSLASHAAMCSLLLMVTIPAVDGALNLSEALRGRDGALCWIAKGVFVSVFLGTSCYLRTARLVLGILGVLISSLATFSSVVASWRYGGAINNNMAVILIIIFRVATLGYEFFYPITLFQCDDHVRSKLILSQLVLLFVVSGILLLVV